MKRKLTSLLALFTLLLLLLCSCTGKSALTPETLMKAENRSELAEVLGCDQDDLDDVLLYAKNLYKILPDGEKETTASFVRGVTEDGLPWVTKEELKPMVTPVIITTENWSDYFAPRTIPTTVSSFDENGNEIVEDSESTDFYVLPGYYYNYTNYSLTMVDNKTGKEFTFSDYWDGSFSCEDGVYYLTTYDDEGNSSTVEYKAEDYTCIKADMIIYKCDIAEELLCCDRWVDDETEYYLYQDVKDDFDISNTFVCVNSGTEEEPSMCYCGLSGVGDWIYGD